MSDKLREIEYDEEVVTIMAEASFGYTMNINNKPMCRNLIDALHTAGYNIVKERI